MIAANANEYNRRREQTPTNGRSEEKKMPAPNRKTENPRSYKALHHTGRARLTMKKTISRKWRPKCSCGLVAAIKAMC